MDFLSYSNRYIKIERKLLFKGKAVYILAFLFESVNYIFTLTVFLIALTLIVLLCNVFLIHFRYLFLVPLESPQNFSMTLTNNSLVTLSWEGIPRESANGDLIGYVVAIKDLIGQTIFNKTVASNVTTIRIETLKAHHQYEATIKGYTNVGAGKLQSLIFFTADGGKCMCFVIWCFQCFVSFQLSRVIVNSKMEVHGNLTGISKEV